MLAAMLDLTGRPALVVGGGPVGRRKAATVMAAGGAATVVDPLPPPADFAGRWVQAEYAPEQLDGVWLVFACGPPAVNARVLAAAAARRVWACDAADPAAGGFVLPAVARAGRITLAVSTAGAAPGLAARLRDELAARLTPADETWADLLADLRPLVKALPADRRRAVFAALTEPHWRQRLAEGGVEAVRMEVIALIRGERGV